MKLALPIGSRRGLLHIVAGTVGGQLVALLAAPLLARLYSPADFGVFTVVSTLTIVVGTVAAFRFELAVPLPGHESDAHSLVVLGLSAAVLTGAVATVGVMLCGGAVADRFHQPKLMPWLWLVPPVATAMAVVTVLTQLAIRDRRYAGIGRRNLGQSLALALTQVLSGAAGVRPGGMIIGYGVGQVAAALSLVPGSRFRSAEAQRGRSWSKLRENAVRYRRFPLWLAPSGLFNILGTQLPVLLIAYRYGGTVAGWLGLTQRVLALPVALVGTAVAQVYVAELSRAARNDITRTSSLFRMASRNLTILGVSCGVVVFAAGPYAFTLLFGAGWTNSGVYARALALSLCGQFIAAPLSQTLIVLGRPGLQFAWDLGRTVLVTAVVDAAATAGASATTAIWVFGFVSTITYGASWLMSSRVVNAAGRPPLIPVVPTPVGLSQQSEVGR